MIFPVPVLVEIIQAFFWTVVVELAVAIFLGCRQGRDLGVIVLVNLLTHPVFSCLFVLGSPHLSGRAALFGYLLVLEMLVTLVEWRVLQKTLSPKAPAAGRLALLMNLISGGLGALRLF